MKNELKKILYIFLAVSVVLSASLFIGWATGGIPAGTTSDISDAPFSDSSLYPGASGVFAESLPSISDETSVPGADPASTPEEASSGENVSEYSEETTDIFPVSYIEKNVTAPFISLYNVTKGRFVYGKNENERCYPASLTKLVTALLATRYLDQNEIITVGEEIRRIGRGSSTAFLVVGYRMKLEVLLDAMLLPSGNDAAYVAAVNIGRAALGNKNAAIDAALARFYELANEYVASIGCEGTRIACPDGYHDDNHYSTARDFVLISREAMKDDLIRKVAGKKVAYDTLADGTQISYTNGNALLFETDYVTGLKTGTTNEAGYCLAATAEYDGEELIVVVMKSETAAARYADVQKLISAAYGWFEH